MGNHWHIRGRAELAVIAALEARAYQRRIGEATLALAQDRGLLGDSRREPWEALAGEVTAAWYVDGVYVSPSVD